MFSQENPCACLQPQICSYNGRTKPLCLPPGAVAINPFSLHIPTPSHGFQGDQTRNNESVLKQLSVPCRARTQLRSAFDGRTQILAFRKRKLWAHSGLKHLNCSFSGAGTVGHFRVMQFSSGSEIHLMLNLCMRNLQKSEGEEHSAHKEPGWVSGQCCPPSLTPATGSIKESPIQATDSGRQTLLGKNEPCQIHLGF